MDHDSTLRGVLIVVMMLLLPVGVYHRVKSQSTGEALDRRQEGVFILATLRPLGAAFWLGMFAWMINPAWMAWSSMSLPIGLRWAGVGFLVAGALMLVWTFRSLGKNLTDTVVTRQQHTLVQHGPYRWIRHPLYSSAALLVAALSLVAANWFFFAVGAVLLCVLIMRTRTEEENLVARFGDSYRQYMERTGRFVPRIRRMGGISMNGRITALMCVALLMPSAAAAQQAEIATTVAFTEGPTVDPDGNVYFTELVFQRIMKLTPQGILSVFRERSNNANGMLIDPQGRLVVCEGAGSQRMGVAQTFKPQVTRTDLKTGKVEVLAEGYQGKPFVGPNDVTIDSKGRLYFTDLPGGAVYRLDAPSQLVRILTTPEIQRPNGIQISPDDSTLYLIEANQAEKGARMIRAFDLRPDGTVTNMRVHYNFYPGRSADGMSIDSQGNLYASAGMGQLRGSSETLDTKTGIYVISPKGVLLKFIPIAEDYITNNAFGGPDMKTLYVTAGKTLYRLRTDIAGLPR